MSEIITQLRDRRRKLHRELREIAEVAAAENRNLTEEELREFGAGQSELGKLDDRIGELSGREQRERDADQAFSGIGSRRSGGPGMFGQQQPTWLPSWRRYKELEARSFMPGEESRALADTGSPFAFIEQSDRWFDMLRAASVVLTATPQANILPMETLSEIVPKVTGQGNAQFIAEGVAISETDPSLGMSQLTAHKAMHFVLVNNELLDDSRPQLQAVLATALSRDMGTAVDKGLLNGSGTAPNPRSLLNFTGATALANGANGLQLSTITNLDPFATAVGTLESLNANLETSAWFMSATLWAMVRKIKDSQSRYQLIPYVSSPANEHVDATKNLFGIPVHVSQNIPVNQTVGTSTDVSPVILQDMSQLLIGMRTDPKLEMSRDFAFNADQTAIRITQRLDIQPVNAAATVVVNGLRAS